MNDDKPKSIWKKSWKGPRLFLLWLVLTIATIVTLSIGILIIGKPFTEPSDFGVVLIDGVVGVSVLFGLWLFIRWVCRRRNFKRFLFGLACFITLIALFYAEEDWRGKHDWDQFKRQWEAKGEHFDWASIVPPPVPDTQNFAMAPVFDAVDKLMNQKWRTQHQNPHFVEEGDQRQWDTNLVDRLEMNVTDNGESVPKGTGNWQKSTMSDLKAWQQYYRSLWATTNDFPVAPQPQSSATDVLIALSKYDSTIEELQQASKLPYSRFPLDYDRDDVWAILLPHLGDLKRCSQVLQLRAIAELQNGQSDKALDDVKLMLRLTASIRTEPFLISHLVRIATLNLALQPIYEGLVEQQWSDAQLVELDLELWKLDFLADYELSMRGELGCDVGVIEFLRHRHLRNFREIFDSSVENNHTQFSLAAVLYYLSPNGWFYQNELRICRFYANWYLPLVNDTERTVSPAALHAVDHALDLELRHRTPENFLEPLLLPSLGKVVGKFACAQESVDLARVAIALERYRLAHGEYPESLDSLAPQFIAKPPHDIINGQPLHYRRTSDGQFVLYSVGWNERDDGGVVGLNKDGRVDINEGDWVWRYPAK